MVWTAPAPLDLQRRFPRFSSVDAGVVQTALDEAARMVDDSWLEGDRTLGLFLYACHTMTLDGFGEGVAVEEFQSVTSGSLTLSRFPREATAAGDTLLTTMYGKRFLELLKRNKPGVLVAAVGGGDAVVLPIYPGWNVPWW